MEKQQQSQQTKKPRQCFFCANNNKLIDYKDMQTIRRYISSFGKIVPRKRSCVCMKHQRELSNAIKRARIMALIPFVAK